MSSYKNLILFLISTVFFTFFCFGIYKIVDSEYNTDVYKSQKISIQKIIKTPEMLKFVPYHLKTKTICIVAVRKLPFVIRQFLDQYKT